MYKGRLLFFVCLPVYAVLVVLSVLLITACELVGDPRVESIVVSTTKDTVRRGETLEFTVIVNVLNSAPINVTDEETVTWKTVTWKVEGNSPGTVITQTSAERANLSVANDEIIGAVLRVTATSVIDPKISGYAEVMVVRGDRLPVVLSVEVSTTADTVGRGETLEFSAVVNVLRGAEETVTWKIEGNSPGTVITQTSAETANLYVANDEIGHAVLKVTATSTFDSDKSGYAEVTVRPDLSSIVSPYSDINWQSYGQYKAGMHVHTQRSDGNDVFSAMIEAHYSMGYDIMAVTDHNVLNRDWISGENAVTESRYGQLVLGTDRDNRGMLRIPFTNEQSYPEHLNSYFTDFNNNVDDSTLESNIQTVENLGGISHINHPGRYYAGDFADILPDANTIAKYVDLFMKYESCLGMEIVNNGSDESDRYVNDRYLWDKVLMQTIPNGRFVWGYANDDTHSIDETTGYNFNMFLMTANTPAVDTTVSRAYFRTAMESGHFYPVSRRAVKELGKGFVSTGPTPAITDIAVNNQNLTITITASNAEKIVWISDGKEIAQNTITGNGTLTSTISLNDHKDKIGSYVRANIMGMGGIAFTQPFGLLYE